MLPDSNSREYAFRLAEPRQFLTSPNIDDALGRAMCKGLDFAGMLLKDHASIVVEACTKTVHYPCRPLNRLCSLWVSSKPRSCSMSLCSILIGTGTGVWYSSKSVAYSEHGDFWDSF